MAGCWKHLQQLGYHNSYVVEVIYLIGSLRNAYIPELADTLRDRGYDVFDDWYSAGPDADDCWMAHEKFKGHSFVQALDGPHAWDVFRFDKRNLDKADIVVLVMPAGKSGHLEFGYAIGTGKRGIILMDKEPERFDVMYRFADKVVVGELALLGALKS